MKVAIYSNSSFGGCYEYAKQIAETYSKQSEVERCYALFPKDGGKECPQAKDILMKDLSFKGIKKIFGKFYFLYRSLVNPLRAYKFVKKNKVDLLIFNDFDQVTSFFWTSRYKKRNFKTAIILHDPDRSAYFSKLSWSEKSMQRIMDVMDLAFYHETLPDLCYYKNPCNRIKYAKIPHGIYPASPADSATEEYIRSIKSKGLKVVSITGNIRAEKNYKLAIKAVTKIPDIALLIAGTTVTSTEDVNEYKKFAESCGVEDRVFFLVKYLNGNEISSIFKNSDIVLLYYSQTFKSQSGILNSLSPFRPKLIVSKTESGMAYSASKYKLAVMVEPDNLDALVDAIKNYPTDNPYVDNWTAFSEYSSWNNNVRIQLSAYNTLVNNI